MRRRSVAALVFAGAAVLVAAPDASAQVSCPPGPTAEAETLCWLNVKRAEHGRFPLRSDPRLARSAHSHALDMVARRFFAHTTPEGVTLSDRIARTGWMRRRPGWAVGETLAWGTGVLSTPESVVRAWLASPSHRRVLLAARYRRVGFGTVPGTPAGHLDGGLTYTGDFGSR